MSDDILLSILIPSIPERAEVMMALVREFESQIGSMPVEVLVLMDNKRRSIGLKRDALVQSARGKFCAFCDDDDAVSSDYVKSLVEAINAHGECADVISFLQNATINNGNLFTVDFKLSHINEEARKDGDGLWMNIKRKPFHVCAWRTILAKTARFPDISYGEDSGWLKQLWSKARTEFHIDKVLHHYRYNDDVTAAPKDTYGKQP